MVVVLGFVLYLANNPFPFKFPSHSSSTPSPAGPPPYSPPATPASPTRFVDLADQAGLNYQWTLPGKQPRSILQTIGNGCAFLDYNNDGNLDILFVGPTLALYKGDGHGHFMDVSHETGLDKFHGYYLGCAVADYDNDGYEDIFITGYNTALLLHNEGGKTFQDVTKDAGIKTDGWSSSAAWGDIDNDGKLDLYVCRYVVFGPNTEQVCTTGPGITKPIPGVAAACPPTEYKPEFGILYHNDGNGHFTDVTRQWGLDKSSGNSLGAAFADFDGSGRQSLFVANDQLAADFYVNKPGHFSEIARSSGTAVLEDGTPYSGMGVDWGDYDNDGRLDLAVMDFMDQDKNVFHNEGQDLFSNKSVSLGMHDSAYPWVTFGAKWIDYDNDGWLDLVTSQAGVSDTMPVMVKTMHLAYRDENTFEQPTLLYHNDGGTKFLDVSGGLVDKARRRIVGRGLAIGDYDNDGRMDVLIVDSEGKPLLLHNETPQVGHWLIVRLVGTKSNRDGLGALIKVSAGDLNLVRLCQTDGSYMSASDKRVHIGLGGAKVVSSLSVQWPSGQVDKLANIPADQIITVVEGKGLSR
jgi:hypothetical protein